jgi:hypothetical protein
MAARNAVAALAAALVVALPGCPAASSTSTPQTPAGGGTSGCSGYHPICIDADPVCSVDANGCSICTCQSRLGSETAPDFFVPGTGAPAPPMNR